MVRRLRRSGLDIVSLDEMYRRLTQRDFKRRFVCLTFDDGYRDNLQWAYPILKKHEVPFALYVPTSFPDRIGEIWWVALERVVANNDRIGLYIDGRERRFDCARPDDKKNIYEQLYWWLRSLETEDELRAVVRDLAARYGIDMKALCDELCMSWEDIAELSRDPLVTIGAHTVNHYMLKKTTERVARSEMEMSRAVIESAIGIRPEHFAYPVGDPASAGSARIRDRGRTRLQDRGDDAAGRSVPRAPQSSDGAAAHFAEWRVPAIAVSAGADVGDRDRNVERLPAKSEGGLGL